jgi:hypothetical protein
VVETEVRAGKGGRLFGSVTNLDVKKLLDEKGYDIDRRRIELKDPIKTIGEFEVLVKVGQDVTAAVTIVVKPLGGQLEDKSVDGESSAPPAAAPEPPAPAAAAEEASEA